MRRSPMWPVERWGLNPDNWPRCGTLSPMSGDRCYFVPSGHDGPHRCESGEVWMMVPCLDGEFRAQVKTSEGFVCTAVSAARNTQ